VKNFVNLAINKGYVAFFIAHPRNSRISTSGLKSDVTVTIVLIDPDFLKRCENFGYSLAYI